MQKVAALFIRHDSIYKRLEGVEAFDEERDARTFPGGMPVVAHQPCEQWGQLAHQAHVDPESKALAPWAVEQVRTWGGVLEHPNRSKLWEFCGLPAPGKGLDRFGGWTLAVSQKWWGHEAEKLTLLYVVGVNPFTVSLPLTLGRAAKTCGRSGRRRDGGRNTGRKEIGKAAREHTPEAFARFLIDLARDSEQMPGQARRRA